ncbi:hypothetical protein [Shewanella sp. 10N.286.52.B9]|uniref:hypothetical protein n=1 Tax=Shewanella sp. 10N.286.52.B9 TaxID=1880837 RepID=UPI000C8306D0|nr:hypothetical protein [Shewanella sp. 10N.286.52.B9]PMG48058.1 hypothetical protein BCU91_02945 [Shewanella sp. 10N.286.52.B9]
MFSKITGTLLKTESSFSIISAFEKMKWVFLFLNLIHLVLGTILFTLSIESVGRLIISILLILITFSYQRRWCFDASRKVLTQFHGFKLGIKAIYTIAQQEFDYANIKNIELKKVHHANQVILHLKDTEHTPPPKQASISLKVKTNKISAVVQQLRTHLASQGLNVIGQFGSTNSKEWPSFGSVSLDQDTVKAFIGINLFNNPVMRQFPVILFMLPLPSLYFHRVWIPSYINSILALFIVYSSQNVIAAIVVGLFGVGVSAVRRKLICDKHYTFGYPPITDIVISEEYLAIPAVYFENKQAKQIKKTDIQSIDIEWNWYKNNGGELNERYSEPYVFNLNIDVKNESRLVLAGQSFDSKKFVIALCELGYSATLTQITKTPMVWRYYILGPLVVFLIGLIGYGLYMAYFRLIA